MNISPSQKKKEKKEELQSKLRMEDVCFMLDELESVVQLLKRRKKLRPS